MSYDTNIYNLYQFFLIRFLLKQKLLLGKYINNNNNRNRNKNNGEYIYDIDFVT